VCVCVRARAPHNLAQMAVCRRRVCAVDIRPTAWTYRCKATYRPNCATCSDENKTGLAKLSLCLTKHHAMKTYWGVEVKLHALTLPLDGEWSASRPSRFTPRERAPRTHWIGGWMGPKADLDAVARRKIPSPSWESNPDHPIVQPVARRYTAWAIRWKYCLFMDWTTASSTALGPTMPPIEWIPGDLSLGVKRPRRVPDHSPPCSVEFKNACRYTSTPSILRLHGVVLS
jgi:hypothetical protein